MSFGTNHPSKSVYRAKLLNSDISNSSKHIDQDKVFKKHIVSNSNNLENFNGNLNTLKSRPVPNFSVTSFNNNTVNLDFSQPELKKITLFNVLYVNIQCVRNKILEIENFCDVENVDIICLAEHWLTENQVDVMRPTGFMPASVTCRSISKNGGVGIYTSSKIKFSKLNLNIFNSEINCEICGIKILKATGNINILCIYRSPNGDIKMFFYLFEQAIKQVLKNHDQLIICGDFNINFADIKSLATNQFLNLLRSLNLTYINNKPTRGLNCIDNILVNFSTDYYKYKIVGGHFGDHNPFVLKLLNEPNFKQLNKPKRVLKRTQNEEQILVFIELLKEESWPMIESYKQNKIDVANMFNTFFRTYIDLWYHSSPLMPKSFKKRGEKICNWYTKELANLRNKMLSFCDIYKNLCKNGSVQSQTALMAYKHTKALYRLELIKAKRKACANYIENSSNKCRAAWKIISQEHSPTHTQDIDLDPECLNSYFIDSPREIWNNIPNTNTAPEHFLGCKPETVFHWRKVTGSELKVLVSNFSNSKSFDHYWISNYLIKKTIDFISEPLAFVLSQCLQKGFFSDLLKISKITPVFKKGDKRLPQNYRPISLIPIFSKILESVMHNQLNSYFSHNNLFTNCQFGFRKGLSTTTALLNLVDKSMQAFEKKESVALALCDLSRAFDCIPYDILINKLEFYGVENESINIIKSYLTGRKQYVSIRGLTSTLVNVSMGVPQGSILGPFFFSIAINDLPQNLNTQSIIYADDVTLVASHVNVVKLETIMRNAQNLALNWFSSNKLFCNLDKTQQIILSLKHSNDLHTVKLLGFHIDSKLNWQAHIHSVSKKLNRVNYLIWKLREILDIHYLRITYFSLFQSHIAYGLLIWGHSHHASEILLLQKKVIRTMSRSGPLEHCRPLFISLKIPTIVNLYIYHVLLYAKSNLQNLTTRQEIHNHNTRHKEMINIPRHRLTKTSISFQINSVNFFNKLPLLARTIPLTKFKVTVYNWLVQNPFYSVEEYLKSNVNLDLN